MKKAFIFFFVVSLFNASADENMAWSSPVTVYSQSGLNPQGVQLALHPTSHAAALIWKTEDGGDYNIQGSYFNGTTWAVPTDLATSSHIPKVAVGIDSSGKAVAVWDQFDDNWLSVMAARFDGSDWTDVTELESLGDTYFASFPSLSVNSSGNAAVNWQNSSADLRAHTYSSTQNGWVFPYDLNAPGLSVSTLIPSPLQLARDNSVTAILFTPSDVYSEVMSNAVSPNAPSNTLLLPYGAVPAEPIFKQIQGNGRAAFIFQDSVSKYLFLATNYSGDVLLDSWKYTIPAVPNPKINVLSYDLSINPNQGNSSVAAIWNLGNGTIQLNLFNGVEWKVAVTMSSNGSSPSIAINPTNNHIVAVWADLTAGGSNNTIKLSEFDGTSWSTPASISSASSTLGAPKIQINATGYGIIIWDRLVGSYRVVEAVTSQ